MSDRESTKKALFAYLDRSEKERIKLHPNKASAKKANGKPEKLVEKDCMAWLIKNGFDVQVIESKAVLRGGEWRQAGAAFGTCDILGTSPYGEAVFIELKALGKRCTFWRSGNDRQTEYLVSKIKANAFAVVVDNSHDLDRWFHAWRGWKLVGLDRAREYLTDLLPAKPKRKVDDTPLFED